MALIFNLKLNLQKMSLANVRLIATDMDGTLLNSNHRVSEHFFSLFKSLMQYNIIFVAASGRPYYSIIDKLDSIKDNITVIAENGGIVIKNNAVLHSKPINKKKLKDITTKLSTLKDISVIYCTKNKAFIKVSDSNLIETFSEYYPNFKRIDSTNEISDDIIKLALYHNDCSEKHIYPHFKHLELNYNIKVSGKNWLDISDKNSNKGNAIKMLQKDHNILIQKVMMNLV